MAGTTLVVLSFLLIGGLLLRKNEPYFNLRSVIQKHLGLFRNCRFQYIVFYVFPLLFAVGLAMLCGANRSFFSELSVILSILISVLFAILSILCGHDYSAVSDEFQKKRAKGVLQDTMNAIVFTVFLCIFLLLYGLVFSIIGGLSFEWLPFDMEIIKRIVSGLAYYLIVVILLNVFLIFKHMSKLVEFILNAPKKKK